MNLTTGGAKKILGSKLYWISLLYFAEGLPLGSFYDLFPVYFRQQGIELSKIGMLSLLGLAWTLKFLWAPIIDHTRKHRYWMAAADVCMGLVMIEFSRESGFGTWVWLSIGAFTAFSATNDIAIDGYTIEQLDKTQLGLANGFRIGFYRVGMLTAGVLLWFSDQHGWPATYCLAAVIFLVNAAISLSAPKEPIRSMREAQTSVRTEITALIKQPILLLALLLFLAGLMWPILGVLDVEWLHPIKSAWWFRGVPPVTLIFLSAYLLARAIRAQSDDASAVAAQGPVFGAVISLLNRKHVLPLIGFVLLYKLGDSAIGFMIKPFWVDSGFTNTQIGLVSVNIGLALSIAGGVVGGWYADKVGLFRGLWVLGLWQGLANVGYVVAALVVPKALQGTDISIAHQALMYSASAVESFTMGLGSAAFLAFLMIVVDKSRATTEYAILSSIFAFSRSIAGWAGGIGAQEMGYANYFILTCVLGFLSYALLPWVKTILLDREAAST